MQQWQLAMTQLTIATAIAEIIAFVATFVVLYYVVRAAVRDGVRDATATSWTTTVNRARPEHAATRPAELDQGADR